MYTPPFLVACPSDSSSATCAWLASPSWRLHAFTYEAAEGGQCAQAAQEQLKRAVWLTLYHCWFVGANMAPVEI